jgi:hypothetical protein
MVVFLLLACMFHQVVPLIARAPEATPQMPPYPMQTIPRLAQAKRSPNTNTVGIVTGRPTETDFAIRPGDFDGSRDRTRDRSEG